MVQLPNIFYPETEYTGRIFRHYHMNLPHIPQSIKINIKVRNSLYFPAKRPPYINNLSRRFASNVQNCDSDSDSAQLRRYKLSL